MQLYNKSKRPATVLYFGRTTFGSGIYADNWGRRAQCNLQLKLLIQELLLQMKQASNLTKCWGLRVESKAGDSRFFSFLFPGCLSLS